MPTARTFAFVFVCQAGALEIKSLLLAASLRRYGGSAIELIAAIPADGAPSTETVRLLSTLGARSVPITNDIDPAYPIANKVSCLRVQTSADRLVFLDSDMLLVRDFAGDARLAAPFAAKPADLANVVHLRYWRRAYAAVGLKLPEDRVATSLFGQLVPPYFNAGFICVDPAAGLGDAWLECCKRIDARWGIPLKRPHLDQIALPVALRKLGLPYECLDERYNFPAHLKPIDATAHPLFVHYHTPEVLRREPLLIETVRALCDEHAPLAEMLRADEGYGPLLRTVAGSARPSASRTPPVSELLVTGIPRSGTSYLCNILHRFDNCVILNEPDEVSRPLRKQPIPYGVGTFYRDIRRDVLEGKPIRNKLRDGKVTDETMEANEQTQYVPTVTGPDFVLGAKSPLGFLSRLDGLWRAMPQARIVACVRNPYDTIASWKTTFSHLRDADVTQLSTAGLRDPFLSARHRLALEEVARMRNPAWRRAAWWRYLAELILDAGPNVLVVRYADAVTDPASVAAKTLAGFNAGDLREPLLPSTVRAAKRSALTNEDVQAIRALCGEPAAALGLADEWIDPMHADMKSDGAGAEGASDRRPLVSAERTEDRDAETQATPQVERIRA